MAHTLHVTKLDAARRQLETAIKLYFANDDIVSIHTLAFSAFQITKNLCDLQDEHPGSFTTWMKQNIPEKYSKDIWERTNRAANFFKHADRDPGAMLEYIPDQHEFFILMGIEQYRSLTQEYITAFDAFRIWFLWHHPTWLAKADDQSTIRDICGGFDSGNRQGYFTEIIPLLMKARMQSIAKRPH